MRLPSTITVRLSSSPPTNLDGLIVQLQIHAGRKNPYYIHFPKTDPEGTAKLERDDIIGQFTDHWEMALMDYDGDLESASPIVEVSLFDPTWSIGNRSLALAWPLFKHEQTKWSSREQEYEHRVSSRNAQFSAKPVSVNLEQVQQIDIEVQPRAVR